MSNKQGHDTGAGVGADAVAVTGAVVGSVAEPGTVVGTVAGAAAAAVIGPNDYSQYFQANYRSQPYYSSGRDWSDYQPAYQYGYDTYGQYRGQRFEDVEAQLERDWAHARARSRLAWAEARDAVRDGWHRLQRALPGDADRAYR